MDGRSTMKCLVKAKFETGVVSVEDINLLHFIKNPSDRPKKELPLWRFITLKEGAERRANQELYDTIHMLIVEFDNKNGAYTSIEKVEELAKDYSYAIHTTSSHTPAAHRFRLMLPLDISYPESFWRLRTVKDAMIRKFPGLDDTCFVNYQCIPALPANPSNYYYKIQNGRKFGYEEIREIVEAIEFDEEMDRKFNESLKPKRQFIEASTNYDRYKEVVDEKMEQLVQSLPRHDNGSRYSEFCSVMGTLLNSKYPDGEYIYGVTEVEHMLRSIYWDGNLAKALRSFSRRR